MLDFVGDKIEQQGINMLQSASTGLHARGTGWFRSQAAWRRETVEDNEAEVRMSIKKSFYHSRHKLHALVYGFVMTDNGTRMTAH